MKSESISLDKDFNLFWTALVIILLFLLGSDSIIVLFFLDKDKLSKNMLEIVDIPEANRNAAPTCLAIKISLFDNKPKYSISG